ncbi:hypothetical protein [uncultured Pseudokineococcus sp.]|nr:hypothetical protein [uncultured Pseudokineococcus sp.]
MSKNKGGREARKPKQEKPKPSAEKALDSAVSSIRKPARPGR